MNVKRKNEQFNTLFRNEKFRMEFINKLTYYEQYIKNISIFKYVYGKKNKYIYTYNNIECSKRSHKNKYKILFFEKNILILYMLCIY